MSIKKPILEQNVKEIIFEPENDTIDDLNGLVEKIKLLVVHGIGLANGINWISIELIPESAPSKSLGGYKIEKGKLCSIIGRQIEENKTTPVGQLAIAVNNYFTKNPSKLEMIKKELSKNE